MLTVVLTAFVLPLDIFMRRNLPELQDSILDSLPFPPADNDWLDYQLFVCFHPDNIPGLKLVIGSPWFRDNQR